MAMPAVDGAVRNLRKVQDHINNGMNDIMEVATNMEPGGDACMGNMAALEKVMLEYASMERTLKQFTEAVRSVKSQVQESEDSNVDVQAMLDTAFQDLQRGNSSAELQKHPKLKEFQSRREELLEGLRENDGDEEEEEGDGVGSSAADQSLGEEDLVMTQAELGTKCPFTQQEMTQPLRNLICGHHYDRQAIDELLTHRQKKIRCPLPGCTNTKPINPNDLQSDSDFRRQIERQRRAKKRKMADTMTQ
ncbi:E3 SUMO-protein ligase NSE2-like [Diadema antillarum]|uniref:E3 SUMO-protein ligase NSE2-like n=1 Tax=Diadema antillarum TaxID=105358 RepID=UPI003A89CC3B